MNVLKCYLFRFRGSFRFSKIEEINTLKKLSIYLIRKKSHVIFEAFFKMNYKMGEEIKLLDE